MECGAKQEPPRLYVIADLGYMGGVRPWLTFLEQLNTVAEPFRYIVQIRARSLSGTAFKAAARQARRAIGGQALLLLNGCADLAAELGYDGVHWPESRIPSGAADPGLAFQSAAAHSIAAIRNAERAAVSAVLFSPVFPPRWKPTEAVGVDALRRAAGATCLPVYALGGVSPGRVAVCLDAGAHGIATVSGVATENPGEAARAYLRATG